MDTVKLDTTKLDAIAAGLEINRKQVLKTSAFKVEAMAKQLAPVDTSAMVNSIYTVTQDQDNYSTAQSAARSANKNVVTEAHPHPSGNIVAHVGPSVNYAAYVEFGTSKMRAQPYLGPAVEWHWREINSPRPWQELFK